LWESWGKKGKVFGNGEGRQCLFAQKGFVRHGKLGGGKGTKKSLDGVRAFEGSAYKWAPKRKKKKIE